MTNEELNKKLDELQEEFDHKRVGAEVYESCDEDEDGYVYYVECVKSIKPVKEIIEDFGFGIKEEYESSGSDYDSYIIVLKV